MARSLNKVMIIGRIQPNDPELRYTQNGQAVCTFKVVTDEGYRDKDGNTVERSEWHRIVYWGKAGELIAQYMKKGRRIYVEGRMQTRQWEQDGQTKYTTEIVGQDFLFLDGGDRDDNVGGSSANHSGGDHVNSSVATSAGSEEDDLPF